MSMHSESQDAALADNDDWLNTALKHLDDLEINGKDSRELNWKLLCALTGKSRATLSRVEKLKERFSAVKFLLRSRPYIPGQSKQRRSKDQTIRKLREDLRNAELINHQLYESLLKLVNKLEDHNIDSIEFTMSAGISIDYSSSLGPKNI